jgi:hypothetical protein
MTSARFRECLDALRWSQRGFAVAIDAPWSVVRAWANGSQPIPDKMAAWLERAGRWHETNPLPKWNP